MNYKNQIDPELKYIARNVPFHKGIISGANIFQTISFRLTRIPKGVVNRRITIEGYKGLKLKVEIFEPSNVKEKLPCLIYLHGGAFGYKAAAYHKKLACIYAAKAKCRVYFPDYHLTPKYPYPAAYEDGLSLYRYILDHAEELRVKAEKIGVAGDSAGASVAALICNRYEQENLSRPWIQMLVYPVTDVNMQTDSMKRFSDTPLWNAGNNKRMWQYYCRNLKGEDRYEASPAQSSLPRIIPDTYVETAEYDCLHDEGVLYAERLREAGANVVINETKGTIHGYDLAIGSPIAMKNIEKRIRFLKKGFRE